MRWHRLFDDLEAQWEADARAELRAEVADRTRRERAAVALIDRLAAAGEVELLLATGRRVRGRVADLGVDFVVLSDGPGQRLVPLAMLVQVTGLPRRSAGPREVTALRRFGLGYALRAIARDRAPVVVEDALARAVTGTIEAVGADHLDLTEHPLDQSPRREVAVALRTLPFTGLVCISSG